MIDWQWDYTAEILPKLLWAMVTTVTAALIGYVIALFIGLVFALAQRTKIKILTAVSREIVEFIRSTPLLVQIFFLFYVGPQFGLRLSPWVSGMLAIGVHYGAYLSEVYRAGIDSVPQGQREACVALNFGTFRTFFRVIVPQALPASLPGMGNYLVGIFKDTPMLAVIGVGELMHTATEIGTVHYRYLEPYTLVGVIFLVISLPTAFAIRRLEAAVRRYLGIRR